jgi:peptidyl-prolyl cis-trans isomerase A (cyclophilin A)
MKTNRSMIVITLIVGIMAGTLPAFGEEQPADAKPNPALRDPKLATEKAPDIFQVKMQTTAGDFVIEVHRDWAPNGADRFHNLVKIGYYDDMAFFRVIKGFMAQAGFHADPAISNVWLNSRIQDDPVTQSNKPGMVTFAMSGQPNSRSAQFFINYGDNSYLDDSGFAPFGKVVDGMDTVNSLYGGYGEGAPRGKGPSQAMAFRQGNDYFKAQFPKLDYITTASIVE